MAVDIGRINYQKFYDILTDGDFDHLPKWEDLGKIQQDAWRAAAIAVLQQIDKEREQSEKGLEG